MRAKDLINYAIPPLKPEDDVDKARAWMQEFHMHELPVIDQGKYLGMFNENLLFDEQPNAKKVGDFLPIGSHVFVEQHEHHYEVLKKAYDASSHLIAVVNEENKYIGVITVHDVVEAFARMSSVHSPGSILVLSMEPKNYSMAEIGRIVESEGGKILSSFLENMDDKTNEIRLTLKTNLKDSHSIISSLQRFGYTVTATFGQENDNQVEKERLDTLMRYLDV